MVIRLMKQQQALLALLLISAKCVSVHAQSHDGSQQQLKQITARGLDWLEQQGQAEDGTFSAKAGPGLTALAVTAAIRNGRSLDDAMVKKGLAALERFVKPDGGIYGNGRLKNYETCVAMVCFGAANADGRYDRILKSGRNFVTGLQYSEANGKTAGHPWYGGAGYGGSGRPDLSNTAYLIEALKAAGVDQNDEAMQRALVFISRCQNLESEHNDTKFATLVNDGGFYYEIPVEDLDPSKSPERFTPEGGLRSYGSMTYSGLKSMIYAGLEKDDPRVEAAVDWIQNNYTVSRNPGMGTAGLYYYFHTFGASLDVAELEKVNVKDGESRDWRKDLIAELGRIQEEGGSWSNKDGRWFENDRNLATSFALLALARCRKEE